MAYLSLYRKYRSQDFETIVGQQHIVRTITNAILTGRLAHAYIFAGPRGTGKTSLARILAKALNCTAQDAVTIKPCLKCANCEKIKNGTAVDVIEIDAASNRGIDEIRQLREQVNFVPVESRYKVYIIDEVHMLTTEAFNALLKTLEEPPSHTLFVLATTEIQKIPATILSRCQRLDFRRIGAPEISAHLQAVCQKENVNIEPKAVSYIARLADGGMRDALSLLDQLISAYGANPTMANILEMLGATSGTALQELLSQIIRRDLNSALQMIERMIADGKNIQQVCRDLLDSLRNLLLVALGADSAVDVSAEDLSVLRELAIQTTVAELRRIITIFSRAEADMRWNPNMRLIFELAVMELCENSQSQPAVTASAVKPSALPQSIAPVKPTAKPEPIVAPVIKPVAAPEPVKIEIKEVQENTRLEEVNEINEVRENKTGELTLADVKQSWQIFIDKMKIAKPMLFALLNESQFYGFENNTVTLQFKESYGFHQKEILKAANKEIFKNILREVYGAELELNAVLEGSLPNNQAPAPEPSKADVQTEQLLKIFPGKVIQR